MILPLDAHAHIEPGIAPAELAALRSCVIAVTRTLDEYAQTQDRPDRCVVWGAGCHPGLAREVKGFSASRMRDAIATTPVIGEVGLDGAARTPMESQLAALRAILEVASDTPRLLSLHSYRATGLVVRELREFRPHAAILHWWLGSPEETEAAVAAGAYFSVNASQARSWKSLRLVPPTGSCWRPITRLVTGPSHRHGVQATSQGARSPSAPRSASRPTPSGAGPGAISRP